MSKQCVTHHFACDCREQKFKGLERENAALARWIVYHSDHTSGDHACAECYPHGEAIKPGFRCAVHVARSIDAARKEAQP